MSPITLFGVGLSMGEVISLILIVMGVVTSFIAIKHRLDGVEKRNEKADAKMASMESSFESKMSSLDKTVSDKITAQSTTLNDRLHGVENRVTQQEVIIGRMDEKLSYIHSDLKRLIDLNEKK